MQTREAIELRNAWGDAPCEHPEFDKEYDLGADTGDFICTQCGKEFSRHQRDEMINKREQK